MKSFWSSAVIATVISGIVAYLNSKRDGNLKYITAERNNWREKIREIASKNLLYGKEDDTANGNS